MIKAISALFVFAIWAIVSTGMLLIAYLIAFLAALSFWAAFRLQYAELCLGDAFDAMNNAFLSIMRRICPRTVAAFEADQQHDELRKKWKLNRGR